MFHKIIEKKKEGQYFQYNGYWMSVMFFRDVDIICGCDIDIYINGVKFIFTAHFNTNPGWEDALLLQLNKKIKLFEKKFFDIEEI